MTSAERLLLLVAADTLKLALLNPCAPVDTARLSAARRALDDEVWAAHHSKLGRLLDDLEDAEDAVAVAEHHLNVACGDAPSSLTPEEVDRVLGGKNQSPATPPDAGSHDQPPLGTGPQPIVVAPLQPEPFCATAGRLVEAAKRHRAKAAPGTLTVERHTGRLYLCVNDGVMSNLLARFETRTQAEQFEEVLCQMMAAAHAAGGSGI